MVNVEHAQYSNSSLKGRLALYNCVLLLSGTMFFLGERLASAHSKEIHRLVQVEAFWSGMPIQLMLETSGWALVHTVPNVWRKGNRDP